jgi:putative transposase
VVLIFSIFAIDRIYFILRHYAISEKGATLEGGTLFRIYGILLIMPAKNSNKTYVEGGYYHIYNRGVEKRDIFLDSQDYAIFIKYLYDYLSPKDENALFKLVNNPSVTRKEKARLIGILNLRNYSSEITLLAYCLMPNHFHLFLKQKTKDAIDRLMSSLSTRYTMYFNRRYNRVGALYQGVYKAVLITNESQYIHITRYIHRQALAKSGESKGDFPSSYPEYLGLRKTDWVHPEELLSFFPANSAFSYQKFVWEFNPSDDLIESEFDI